MEIFCGAKNLHDLTHTTLADQKFSTSGNKKNGNAIKRLPIHARLFYLGFLVHGVLALERTIFAELKLGLGVLAVFLGSIVLALAFGALHCNDFD